MFFSNPPICAVRYVSKKAVRCGKLFAATDGDRTESCSREYEKGKTCREVGASRVYQKKLLGNPITRAYNRAYKTHNARIRYGTMTREEFNAWTEEAKSTMMPVRLAKSRWNALRNG